MLLQQYKNDCSTWSCSNLIINEAVRETINNPNIGVEKNGDLAGVMFISSKFTLTIPRTTLVKRKSLAIRRIGHQSI